MKIIFKLINIEDKRKFNIKLFPIYKMFAWDLLFYYAISFMFLSTVKNFSAADIVLMDVSVYTIFKLMFQVPSTIIVDKFGKKNSLIFANICICACIVLIIFAANIYFLAVANCLMALGYVIKTLTESNLLYDSIPKTNYRRRLFAKLDGRGSSFYYYFNAVSCVLTGFLYIINPYLPLIICLMLCVLSTYISANFFDIKKEANVKEKSHKASERIKEYSNELKYSFKFILHSRQITFLNIILRIISIFNCNICFIGKKFVNRFKYICYILWDNFCRTFYSFWSIILFAKLFSQKIQK